MTPQYAGLRTLHTNKPGGCTVLAFPCNQFGGQEPGTPEEIKTFAQEKFDANFPLFDKVEVNGANACELYQYLKAAQPDPDGEENVGWNFTKFLVDQNGNAVARFAPQVTPEEIAAQLHQWA